VGVYQFCKMFEEAFLRKRGKSSTEFPASNLDDDEYHNENFYSPQIRKFPAVMSVLGLFVGFLILYFISMLAATHLPTSVLISEAADRPGVFIAERAFKRLEKIVELGPRVLGSHANDVSTVQLLLKEIELIRTIAQPLHKITVDVQKPSGVVTPVKHTNTVYHQITNVIVRIENRNTTDLNPECLLVNAHFDSVHSSPGASDNAVSVAVALEVFETLARGSTLIKHPIIFLFNGAEEKALLGSHGFITQHIWAKDIGAFINLDAAGAGGREIVFQSGPGNNWLIQAYANAVLYPFASIMGQELFQANIIPSDTDFRILKSYGNIPGLDIAYFRNGYVYHTKYDDIELVPLAGVQRAGANLLALVTHLAQTEWPIDKDFTENVVFFDYLGLFMIIFSNLSWHLLNILLIALAFYQTKLWVITQESGHFNAVGGIFKEVIYCCLSCMFQILAAFTSALIVCGFMTLMGKTMTWFSRPYLLIGIYAMPALSAALFVFLKVSAVQQKILMSSYLLERVQFEGVKLNMTVIILLSYMFGIRSNSLLHLWLASAILGRWMLDRLYPRRNKDVLWLFLHFISLAVPVTQTFYIGDSFISTLVPIAARSGFDSNPEIGISLLTTALTLLLMSFLFSLMSIIQNPRRIVIFLLVSHVFTVVAVLFTPLGFPYSNNGSLEETRPQRVQILHVERTFYNGSGHVQQQESGYWLFGWDRNIKPELLAPIDLEQGAKRVEESQCHILPYCGLPYYFPCLSRIQSSFWAPAPKPIIKQPTHIELVDDQPTGVESRKLTFSLKGPDHMAVLIWPVKGVELVEWSPSKELPQGDLYYAAERPLYFVNYLSGTRPSSPYTFSITLKVPPILNGKPMLDLAVTSHILHGHGQLIDEFSNSLEKFPAWIYAHGWIASYSHWQF